MRWGSYRVSRSPVLAERDRSDTYIRAHPFPLDPGNRASRSACPACTDRLRSSRKEQRTRRSEREQPSAQRDARGAASPTREIPSLRRYPGTIGSLSGSVSYPTSFVFRCSPYRKKITFFLHCTRQRLITRSCVKYCVYIDLILFPLQGFMGRRGFAMLYHHVSRMTAS